MKTLCTNLAIISICGIISGLLWGCEEPRMERHYRENTFTTSEPQIQVTPSNAPAPGTQTQPDFIVK